MRSEKTKWWLPLLSALCLLAGSACFAHNARHTQLAADIETILQKQADAWNRGDLDSFMTAYLNSEDTSYTSGGTQVWGYAALKERYLKKYGDNKDSMGKLKFSDLKVTALGKCNALCIGNWNLVRHSQPTLDGVFSLIFTKTRGDWKIIHDHSSVHQ